MEYAESAMLCLHTIALLLSCALLATHACNSMTVSLCASHMALLNLNGLICQKHVQAKSNFDLKY